MNKAKGFLLLESMTALVIAILGLSLFTLLICENKKVEKEMARKTDYELAQHIMRKNKLNEVVIHDHKYSKKEN